MTTTDSRKRDRDIRDAHETARARDAWAKAGHPIEWFFYDETQTFTREHLTEALRAVQSSPLAARLFTAESSGAVHRGRFRPTTPPALPYRPA